MAAPSHEIQDLVIPGQPVVVRLGDHATHQVGRAHPMGLRDASEITGQAFDHARAKSDRFWRIEPAARREWAREVQRIYHATASGALAPTGSRFAVRSPGLRGAFFVTTRGVGWDMGVGRCAADLSKLRYSAERSSMAASRCSPAIASFATATSLRTSMHASSRVSVNRFSFASKV